MRHRHLLSLLCLTQPILAGPLSYQLRVEVDPAKGTLQAQCRVQGWPAGAPLYLNRNGSVRRAAQGSCAKSTVPAPAGVIPGRPWW